MSDYTVQIALPADSPAFLSRLRAGRFTSPDGVESSFLFNDLSRTREKNASAHQIADSNSTILQDLGSSLHVFSLDVYFVGENCDIEADAFYDSLFEHYTPDAPGILNHPRWGDRNVIPFGSPAQNERYTTEGGISRVTVEFRETTSVKASTSAEPTAADVADDTKQAKETFLDRAKKIAASGTKAYNKFRAVVRDKVATVKNAIDSVTGLADDVRAEVDAIHNGILESLALGAAPAVVLSQVDALIESVASIPQDTVNLATSLYDMTIAAIDSFGVNVSGAKTSDDVKDIGATYQAIATSCIAYSAVASLAVDYTTRDQVGAAIDSLVDLHGQYVDMISTMANAWTGTVSEVFTPDMDIEALVHGIIFDTASILLSRAFSLKSRRMYVLTAPSDPATECWTHYGTMDELAFFCSTNCVIGNEFIELPAGRTIVVYE